MPQSLAGISVHLPQQQYACAGQAPLCLTSNVNWLGPLADGLTLIVPMYMPQITAQKKQLHDLRSTVQQQEEVLQAKEEHLTELEASVVPASPRRCISTSSLSHAATAAEQQAAEEVQALAVASQALKQELAESVDRAQQKSEQVAGLQQQLAELQALNQQEIAVLTKQLCVQQAAHASVEERARAHSIEMARAAVLLEKRLYEQDQAKAAEIESLQQSRLEDQRELSELLARLHTVERARDDAQTQVAILQQQLRQEQATVETMEVEITTLRQGITRVSEDKLKFYDQLVFFNDTLQTVLMAALGTWQPDTEAVICPGCTKAFSFTVRKHHCR